MKYQSKYSICRLNTVPQMSHCRWETANSVWKQENVRGLYRKRKLNKARVRKIRCLWNWWETNKMCGWKRPSYGRKNKKNHLTGKQGETSETLKSAGKRALRRRHINRVYPRASERATAGEEDKKEGKERSTAALPSSGVQIWQAFSFLFLSFFSREEKKNYEKPSFMPPLKGGIRRRHSEWKTQTFLYTSCAFTCQSAAIKRLPHGQ